MKLFTTVLLTLTISTATAQSFNIGIRSGISAWKQNSNGNFYNQPPLIPQTTLDNALIFRQELKAWALEMALNNYNFKRGYTEYINTFAGGYSIQRNIRSLNYDITFSTERAIYSGRGLNLISWCHDRTPCTKKIKR